MANDGEKVATADAPPAAPARSRRWRFIAIAVVVVVVGVFLYWLHTRGRESTDDAEVDGHITQIGARVGGTVTKVLIDNNQQVKAGDVLVVLDPRDYQVAVDRARAELADAEATATAATTGVPIGKVETTSGVSNASGGVEEAAAASGAAERQIQVAQSNFASAQAHLREKQATATKAAKDVDRLRGLVQKDEISQQQFDAAVAAADSAQAAADAAKSDVAAAQDGITVAQQRAAQARAAQGQAEASLKTARTAPDQLRVIRARAASAEARVEQAQAALQQAELNLQYATVKAPSDGVVSRKSVEVG
ncbi:MAG TPA: biotin/lipoyl-binding protein, partial [Vicinamibacterales bacterium]